jgi:hypothetical protein
MVGEIYSSTIIDDTIVYFSSLFHVLFRLRALSTPDATTPLPTSSGSNTGNVFKFSTSKYRYSKDEIIALRANVTERLAEDVRNEIMENLKDVESVFRPNIIDPLVLTAPTPEEIVRSRHCRSSYRHLDETFMFSTIVFRLR